MIEEINRCQIQEWYPKFKSVSINTLIHELPEPFVDYLLDDKGPFLLPISMTNEDAFPNRVSNPDDEEDYQVSEQSDEDYQVSEQSDDDSENDPPPSFPELELQVRDSIASLGGAVFPKLNWSAPKEAACMNSTRDLKCTSFSEVALLLRSSDSITHDLCSAYGSCSCYANDSCSCYANDSCSDKTAPSRPEKFYLALKEWYPSLRPEREFRCFVHSERLIAVCQREVTESYPLLVGSEEKLTKLIGDFFVENVKGRFESEMYTFDVYVTSQWVVKVIDFNPWGAYTLPLMYTWEELEDFAEEEGDFEVDFRMVDEARFEDIGMMS